MAGEVMEVITNRRDLYQHFYRYEVTGSLTDDFLCFMGWGWLVRLWRRHVLIPRAIRKADRFVSYMSWLRENGKQDESELPPEMTA